MWEECEVTRKNIDEGKPGEGNCCPIALAMESHSDEYLGVAVGDGTLDFIIPGDSPDDGYANGTIGLKIHPEDFETFSAFIHEFDQVENKWDRDYLQEFTFRWRL